MNFDASERNLLAGLADELIPAGDGFPAASQAEVTGSGLDQVLSFRPDLAAGLKAILDRAAGRVPAEVVAELRREEPAGFGLLAELVSGAYFLNPTVRAELGYDGQGPQPIQPEPEYQDLLRSVIGRGPIYRPTPGLG